MGKQESADMFGMGNDDDAAPYVIIQIIPADGWRAVFQDQKKNEPMRVTGLACFALVEVVPENLEQPQLPDRAVRPMFANAIGEIEDVEAFEDFLCIVPPNDDVHKTIEAAFKVRAEMSK